jgi:hypothetical protein
VPPPNSIDRRTFLRSAAIALAATQLGPILQARAESPNRQETKGSLMTAADVTRLPEAQGPGSVSDAPNLPDGFTDTFSSRYIDTGDVRLHAVIGGGGPPLLLVHGWPQTWYAWRIVTPALVRDFSVVGSTSAVSGSSRKVESYVQRN